MSKTRKVAKGHALRKGEGYRKDTKLYYFAYMDPLGKRKYIYAKTLPELRKKEEENERNRLDKLDIYLMRDCNLNYVFDRYMETKGDLKGTTRTNYLYTYDRYVRDGFGKRKIADIRFSEVLLFYKAILESGLSISTIENIHTVVHPVFQMAVRDNVLRNNPSDGVLSEIKKSANNKPGVRHALSYEEERKFLDYVTMNPDEIRWAPIFLVMFGTGCRIGELIGLTWDDIDLEKRLIDINHSVSYYPRSEKSYKCEFELGTPKSEAGYRTIPMLDKVHAAFLLERDNQKRFGYCSNVVLGGRKGFVFCNRFGNLHNPSSINRVIRRIVSDCNAKEIIEAKKEKREPVIVPRFSCHIARHTFCTRLCENETNIKLIQTIMGHTDIRTTLEIYAEVTEQKKIAVFEDLNKEDVL